MLLNLKAVLGTAVISCTLLFGVVPTGGSAIAAETEAVAGTASWYGNQFHGRETANGERFNQNGLTAAHRNLPFGTQLRVTNRDNGKAVVVRINDRGPYVGDRVIDVSRGAAEVIGMTETGTAPVKLEIIGSA